MRTDYDAVDQNLDGTQPLETLETQSIWLPGPRASSGVWDPIDELIHMPYTAHTMGPAPTLQGVRDRPRRPVSRRRPRPGAHIFSGNQKIIPVAILITTIALCAMIMLYWSLSYSYSQLRGIAVLVVSENLARWWPLTVYGPWLLAGLSIIRASVQHRTARRSWAVILLSSGTAVALCIGQSPSSMLAMVIVGIPPITALVCFRELVGQFSSGRGPRHAADTLNGPKQGRP
ncbi:DUF2637 domain-containing protein [Streptomyces sp. NBC_00487]|uniref:DUF2637 domain-containing protein n=1 Tax=unclassified Streptomyces TaxID=2593676 RepID=UPI002DD862EE|nr:MULTISPECIES: DUF2637 domain-containing protein [unclassified Streptomyces]WRY96982.1 DUF2637 domain-containing protein [Streptomyces sp. NBC_00481]